MGGLSRPVSHVRLNRKGFVEAQTVQLIAPRKSFMTAVTEKPFCAKEERGREHKRQKGEKTVLLRSKERDEAAKLENFCFFVPYGAQK